MTDHKELLMGLDAMAYDGWKWPMQAAAAIREQAAQLERLQTKATAMLESGSYYSSRTAIAREALRKELEEK